MMSVQTLMTFSLLSALILSMLLPASMTCAEGLACCCTEKDLPPLQSADCCQQDPEETHHASCDKACAHETLEFYSQASQSSASSINFFELRRFHTAKNCRGYSEKRLRPAPKIWNQASTALAWCSQVAVWRL